MESIAIIGTGMAGMSCAARLYKRANLTLFEACREPGGHTHTVDVEDVSGTVPVDTGFMVYNETTYPLLTALFSELSVETVETDMSFGVQHCPTGIEYCGSSLSTLFAQRANLLRPTFWGMIRDILRFNRRAVATLEVEDFQGETLKQFVEKNGFSDVFLHQYLVPMTSAIWSTPPDAMLNFPAQTLIRFMYNHGLLGVSSHHQWRTVKGGSRSYRDKLIAPFRERIQCGNPVTGVRRTPEAVEVTLASGEVRPFDKVVLATHADTTLRLLQEPAPKEQRLLGCFQYSANTITLHTDISVMPRHRRAWASWNYRTDRLADGRHQASTHYWMNSLQHLQTREQYIVSVNEPGLVDRARVHQSFTFDHPMFDHATVRAQFELPSLNDTGQVYFCGSYFRYGFHEDALMAGNAAAEKVLSHLDAHAQLTV